MTVNEQSRSGWDEARPEAGPSGELSIPMLAGAVHDLNNILNAIGGFTRFLIEDLPAHAPPRAFAERIATLSQRAATIAGRLLAIARGERTERRVLDLRDVAQAARAALQSVLPSGARIALQLPNHPVPAWIGDVELFQILLNLCQNAGDALIDGKGRVAISVGPGDDVAPAASTPPGTHVSVGARGDDRRYSVVRVADDGVGMDAAVARRCCEAFFTTKTGTGTGLGLSVVQQIALAVGGAVTLDSAPRRGTTVSVYLPAAPPPGFPLS